MGEAKFIDGDIIELDPSVRVYHIFVNNGIKKIKDLLPFIDNDEKIKQLKGVGAKSLKEIQEIVKNVKKRQNEPLFKEPKVIKSILDLDVSKLGLKFMIWHHLKKGGINTVRDLLTTDEEDLKSLRQIGKISLEEIKVKKEELMKSLSKDEVKELEEIKLNNVIPNSI